MGRKKIKYMQKIISIDNEKIKFLKKLGDKKYRDQTGQFLVENLIIIYDAIQSGFMPKALFIREDLLGKSEKKVKYILDKFSDYIIINEKVNKHFSALTTPSGIAAVFDKPENAINLDKIIIYLNAISDPGNLGTILRTAVAFGLENIVVDEKCADKYNAKTINAAKDAIFKLNISQDDNLKIFKQIKKKMKVFSTSLEGKEKCVFKDKIFCLVLGNEANGVDGEILKLTDRQVKIGMTGNIESLNVAVASGILFNRIFEAKK